MYAAATSAAERSLSHNLDLKILVVLLLVQVSTCTTHRPQTEKGEPFFPSPLKNAKKTVPAFFEMLGGPSRVKNEVFTKGQERGSKFSVKSRIPLAGFK